MADKPTGVEKYQALYATEPHALGQANADILRAVLDCGTSPLDILDLGCGQGRDALALARLEHRVTGVDLAKSGLDHLDAEARAERLTVTTIHADLTTFTPPQSYDAILADRTLHMLDIGPRHLTLERLLDHVRPGGYFILSDEKPNMPGLMAVFAAHSAGWRQVAERRSVCVMRSNPA